tara:strand:+ start:1599 stop:1826 length:228 start_codon:yes stop_codon:yes gene_type:complete
MMIKILILGDVKDGKTMTAAIIAKALADHGVKGIRISDEGSNLAPKFAHIDELRFDKNVVFNINVVQSRYDEIYN